MSTMYNPYAAMGEQALDLARSPGTGFFWSQNGEDIILSRIFRDKQNGTYVDAGSHHPVKFSNTYFLHKFKGWSGINIDAEQKNVDLFDQARPDDINVQALLSNEEGVEIEFNVMKGGLGSTAKKYENMKPHRQANVIGSKPLVSSTLNGVLEKHLETDKIDFMNIDIEGFDLKVLRSLDFDRFKPSVIAIEDYTFLAGRTPIQIFLERKGYLPLAHCLDTTIYSLNGAKRFD